MFSLSEIHRKMKLAAPLYLGTKSGMLEVPIFMHRIFMQYVVLGCCSCPRSVCYFFYSSSHITSAGNHLNSLTLAFIIMYILSRDCFLAWEELRTHLTVHALVFRMRMSVVGSGTAFHGWAVLLVITDTSEPFSLTATSAPLPNRGHTTTGTSQPRNITARG